MAFRRRTESGLGLESDTSQSAKKPSATPRQPQAKNDAGMSKVHRAVWIGRVLFVAFLLGVGGLTGYFLNRYLNRQEEDLATDQFAVIAERALQSALEVVTRKRLSMATMAAVISERLPNITDWPQAEVDGFHRINTVLAATGSHDNMGFAPLVRVDDQSSWESYAYDHFRRQNYPMKTGMKPFGRGIWRLQNGKPIHDADNVTEKRGILFPIFQCCSENPTDPLLLFNFYSEPLRIAAMNKMFGCIAEMTQQFGNDTTTPFPDISCGTMTDHVVIVRYKTRGPASMMVQPIFPANSPRELVGIVPSPIVWDEIFENVFNKDVHGVLCVLESETQTHTYTIVNGQVESFAEGSLQSPSVEHLGQSVNLAPPELHAMGAHMYKLSMYPTDQFRDIYATDNPRNGTVVAVAVLVFAAMVFLLYDYFVRREFEERKKLLEAKRSFMRFVSHEVRTPLNAVVMGLNVLKTELQALFERDTEHRSEIDKLRVLDLAENGAEHDEALSDTIESQRSDGLLSTADQSQRSTGNSSGNQLREEGDEKVYVPRASMTNGKRVSVREYRDCMELLDDIQKGTNAAVTVLNDVLNYDKIEHKSLKLELSILPVLHDFERTVLEFNIPASKKEVDLKLVFEADSTSVPKKAEETSPAEQGSMPLQDLTQEVKGLCLVGDSSRIAQVLRNIVSNALKFTPANGSIEAKLKFTRIQQTGRAAGKEDFVLHEGGKASLQRKGTVEYIIRDTGAGMTEVQLHDLFGEGVQFNASKLQSGGGSGLGLYITKGIVEQHRGTIEAHSDGLGMGTTFTVRLPVYAAPDELTAMDSHEQNNGAISTHSTSSTGVEKLRLLVVDDALSNRKFLVRLLNKKGHDCDQAENGSESVDLVEKSMEEGNPYHAILMDFEMPIMDGPTATAEIRNMGCDVFVVGITGNMLDDDVAFFKGQGANHVLPKPLQLPVLEEVLIQNGILAP